MNRKRLTLFTKTDHFKEGEFARSRATGSFIYKVLEVHPDGSIVTESFGQTNYGHWHTPLRVVRIHHNRERIIKRNYGKDYQGFIQPWVNDPKVWTAHLTPCKFHSKTAEKFVFGRIAKALKIRSKTTK